MRKEEIPSILDAMARRYFPNLEYHFKGFYYKDSPEIGVKTADNDVLYNEKNLHIREDQAERLLVHELQHIQDQNDLGWGDNNESDYVLGFIFHPDFENLYTRLEKYYKEQKGKGLEFNLNFLPLPKTLIEMSNLVNNYASPSEVLARLRGYQHFLNQKKEGVDVQTLPYESIEAFKEEDLKLLSVEYRKELAKELKQERPEIFERGEVKEIQIDLCDLSEPPIS